MEQDSWPWHSSCAGYQMLSGSGGCWGIISHLDCSQRLLDCAGEALVRSVDAGLLVCGRTNLGKEKLIVIDKGLLKRPECEIFKSLLHTPHHLGAGCGPSVDDELDRDLGAGGALQHQDVA